jgi:hypothetical protein
LTEEYKLEGFENRLLRRIFGTEKEEITAGSRKQHSVGLHSCIHQIFSG